MLVNLMHEVDRPLCFGGWPERGCGKKVCGALQPSPGIGSIVRVLCDASHRKRVQRLEEQCTHSADKHRRIRVHPPNRCIVVKPAGLIGVE